MRFFKLSIFIFMFVLAVSVSVIPVFAQDSKQDRLGPNGVLNNNQSITSGDGRFTLLMQDDCNLVLYENGKSALWSSNTAGVINGPCWAVMQDDGNLVVYGAGRTPIWASNTSGSGLTLIVQNDGNLAIYPKAGKAVWGANSGYADGDGDGFADNKDDCPNEYSLTNEGCPKTITPVPTSLPDLIIRVNFTSYNQAIVYVENIGTGPVSSAFKNKVYFGSNTDEFIVPSLGPGGSISRIENLYDGWGNWVQAWSAEVDTDKTIPEQNDDNNLTQCAFANGQWGCQMRN